MFAKAPYGKRLVQECWFAESILTVFVAYAYGHKTTEQKSAQYRTFSSSYQPGQFLAALWEEFTGWLGETFGAGKVMAAPLAEEKPRARGAIVAPPTGTVWKNYVFVGGQRVAVRVFADGSTVGEVSFLLSDHLGSLSVVADASGTLVAQVRYTAFGEQRLATGEAGTDYRYTGQLSKMDTVGLLFFKARWLDPVTGHFAQADTLVPDPFNVLDWDRYLYVRANPLRFTDPTGHCIFSAYGTCYIEDNGVSQLAPPSTENWEVLLLTAVTYKETGPKQNLYPEEWSLSIAWSYLNRTSLLKAHKNNLWKATKGVQSAVSCLYQGCEGKPAEISETEMALPDNPTEEDLFKYFSYVLDKGIKGKNGKNWALALDIAQSAYSDWKLHGTGSTADPTSKYVPGGATDFRMALPDETLYQGWGSPSRPTFHYYRLGPVDFGNFLVISPFRYLYLSNKLFSDERDIYGM